MTGLPFAVDLGGLLAAEPVARHADGVAFGPAPDAPPHDPDLPPLLTVAWVGEAPGTVLEDAVAEDLVRLLSDPAALLIDRDGARALVVHQGPGGRATVAEQWRSLAGGRRWTVSALTALADQPDWGPRLAAVAGTFRA